MNRTIILLSIVSFAHGISYGQDDVWRNYTESRGFCSTSVLLFTDSSYLYESGCEGNSKVSFGEWRQMNDTVTFTPFDIRNINDLISIQENPPNKSDSLFVIHVIDINGHPIPNFSLSMVPRSAENYWVDSTTNMVVVENNDTAYSISPVRTDKSGVLRQHPNQVATIVISELYTLFSDIDAYVVQNSEPCNITIKINIHKNVFSYPEIEWTQLPKEQMIEDNETLRWLK